MKEFIKNKKNVIISFSVVLVGILLIGSAFVIDYYETQKVVVPVKSGDSKEIPIKEVEPAEEKPADNPTSNNAPVKTKTEYEQVLEKYTFGDEHFYAKISNLLNNKLNDENKLYITLKNSSSLEKTKDVTCDKVLPGLTVKDNNNSFKVESNGVAGQCYSPTRYYDYNDLNEMYHSLFGNDSNLPIIKGFIPFVDYGLPDPYAYSDEVGGYVKLSCNCGGTYANPIRVYRIINTNKTDNNMIIDIAFLEVNYDNQHNYSFNSGSGRNYAFDSLDKTSNSSYYSMIDSIYENEIDYLRKYRFNFNKGEKDYYLVSIDNLN